MHEPNASQPVTTVPASQRTWNDSMSQLDMQTERLRAQLPAAPPGLLDGYMRFAPWIAIFFGILGVLFSLALIGLGAVLSPLLLLGGAPGVSAGGALFLALIVGLLTAALEIVGGYLMHKGRSTGWWLLGLGLAISVLTNLVHGSILVLVVVVLIAYIHLQVKPNYR